MVKVGRVTMNPTEKGEQMDYIKKIFCKLCKSKENPATTAKEKNTANNNTFKRIIGGTVAVAATVCCIAAVSQVTADNNVPQSSGNVTEESVSDDGSAPGHYLAVSSNVELTQSVTISLEYSEEDKDIKETQKLTEEESVQEVTEHVSASAQGNESQTVAQSEYIVDFSEEDYKVLCTIVEAEAGDQDEKGRILVANVILNRVLSSGCTITEVVFSNNGRTYQFSPTRPGGSYYKTTASQLTIECVDRALKGEDYSEGAMYFAMKTSSNSWFNTSLTFLFKHGDHYFYK